jgi:hypothetical protein
MTHTPQAVGLPWKRDRPVAQTSTWHHTTLTRGKTPILPAGFEPAIPASELPLSHALHRAATTVGFFLPLRYKYGQFGYHSSYFRRITASTVATCSTESAPADSNTLQNLTHSKDILGPTVWNVSAIRAKAFKLGFAQLQLTVSRRRVESRHISNFWQTYSYIHVFFRTHLGCLYWKRHDLWLVPSNAHYTEYTQNLILTNPVKI